VTVDAIARDQRRPVRSALAIAVAVMAISVLHYLTSLHSVVLHEVLKRLYYVPIVVAAVMWGTRGGLATSSFSTLLYMPHVVFQWHAWPVLEAEQYGEVLMFNVVASVAGVLADRLHAERTLHRDAAGELRDAYARLRAGNDERVRMDRLVTIGRIASGIAHEVRTPLAGLLGSLEILENEFTREHPKAEFVAIAKRQISRLQEVVTEFLEFAQPAPPAVRPVDLGQLIETTARLARITLARRGVSLDAPATNTTVTADVDAEQVQRALLGIMLADTPALRDGHISITMANRGDAAQIAVELEGVTSVPAVSDLFEAFPATACGHGLALATAERLIANQHGAVKAEVIDGGVRFVIDLPLAQASRVASTPLQTHAPEQTC
jgi:two-component system, NtrC family, sensor histidine kinase HydH